jgi:hypothetical protein
MYASQLRARLDRLQLERRAAEAHGLIDCAAYMEHLSAEISECRAAFVGATVTEVAVARAEATGRLVG